MRKVKALMKHAWQNLIRGLRKQLIQKLEIPAIISVQLPQKLVRIPLQRCQREMI